ncbi:unnamed protein product [Cyprideis torosa]|uniref:Uncharacterized protein n=1 Tax=Cyprideis torosa TaxID=163714 RepID=A0A7R8W053_9CRUS|nr:unnamed protein product [Cyprideis torosa]CAG0879381.1 unnamed protein product [Cyprideis torosa]
MKDQGKVNGEVLFEVEDPESHQPGNFFPWSPYDRRTEDEIEAEDKFKRRQDSPAVEIRQDIKRKEGPERGPLSFIERMKLSWKYFQSLSNARPAPDALGGHLLPQHHLPIHLPPSALGLHRPGKSMETDKTSSSSKPIVRRYRTKKSDESSRKSKGRSLKATQGDEIPNEIDQTSGFTGSFPDGYEMEYYEYDPDWLTEGNGEPVVTSELDYVGNFATDLLPDTQASKFSYGGQGTTGMPTKHAIVPHGMKDMKMSDTKMKDIKLNGMKMSDMKDMKMSDMKDMKMGNMKDMKMGDMKDMKMSDIKDMKMGNMKDMKMGDMKDMKDMKMGDMKTMGHTTTTQHPPPKDEERYFGHPFVYGHSEFIRPQHNKNETEAKKKHHKKGHNENIRFFKDKKPEPVKKEFKKQKKHKKQHIPDDVKKWYEKVRDERLKKAKKLKGTRPIFQSEEDHRDYAVGALYDKITTLYVPAIAAAGVGMISTLFLPAIARRTKRSVDSQDLQAKENDEDLIDPDVLVPLTWEEVGDEIKTGETSQAALGKIPWRLWGKTIRRMFTGEKDTCTQRAMCQLGKLANSLRFSRPFLDVLIYFGSPLAARRAIVIKDAMNMGSCDWYRCDGEGSSDPSS